MNIMDFKEVIIDGQSFKHNLGAVLDKQASTNTADMNNSNSGYSILDNDIVPIVDGSAHYNYRLTGRLRWIKVSSKKVILQQEWIASDGHIGWIDVPIVEHD